MINERSLNLGINQMLSLQGVASRTPPPDQSGCREVGNAGSAVLLALLHRLRISWDVRSEIRTQSLFNFCEYNKEYN